MMKVLIIEDEKLNAEHLAAHIQRYGQMQVLEVLSSNAALQDWLGQNPMPDLIFSDIQLLDGTVFQSLEQGIIQCPIIFTTAFDTFYQDAFDANGIAYLLKPISYDRFQKAMDKFFRISGQKEQKNWQMISELISQTNKKYKERILVKSEESMQLLELKEVVCIQTNEGVCKAHTSKGQEFDFRYKLSDLAKELDGKQFFQINRSELVNIDFIDRIEPFFNDRISVRLRHFKQSLTTSAAQTSAFRRWLEG